MQITGDEEIGPNIRRRCYMRLGYRVILIRTSDLKRLKSEVRPILCLFCIYFVSVLCL